MIGQMLTAWLRNYQFLAATVKDLTWNQWRLLVAQSECGSALWKALLGASGPASPSSGEQAKVVESGGLEKVAIERLKSGFAPPREIYDAQNRDRIDWSSVPGWARAPDPEIFEGAHEG
jgi:hypothetical protein